MSRATRYWTQWLRVYPLLTLLGIALPSLGLAFTLKTLIMPGKVIEAHASIEEQCDACHESNESQKQSKLCYVCHEDIGVDVMNSNGLHGRHPGVADGECSSCHTEHDGRAADITGLDPKTFEHQHTNFPLLGAHDGAACSSCHVPGVTFREAPQQCSNCHADEDSHKGTLGAACESCHVSTTWTLTRFDHATTGFLLEGAHRGAVCTDCHRDQQFAGTTTQCAGCHRSEDIHAGRNGTACDGCHTPSAWPVARFDHTALAGFTLVGAHQQQKCESCHVQNLAAALPRTCVGCHQSDDPHGGKLGTECSTCHGATEWPETAFDHVKASGFALSGAHESLQCTTCHENGVEAPLGRECASCHDADPHRGQLGTTCEQCHADTAWLMPIRFDHGLASFPLLGKHSSLACTDCHASAAFHDAGATCSDCHAGEDPHQGTFTNTCATCHNPTGWDAWRFDHDRQTQFALTGAHRDVGCAACHRRPLDAMSAAPDDCVSCHRRDDPHSGQFGADCGSCHSSDSFTELRGR